MPNLINIKNDRTGFKIRNKTTTVSEIIIYKDIGKNAWWDEMLSAEDFAKELNDIPDTVNTLEVRINSNGGDVFEGITMYSRLLNHPAEVHVYVDGIAASIASIIAMAGDKIFMNVGSTIMIHKPWTFALGNSDDLENTIQRLEDVEDRLINIYRKKTGIERDELRQMLRDETWMDHNQAIEKGFATELMDEEAEPIAASLGKVTWFNKKPNLQSRTDIITKKKDQFQEELNKLIEG